MDHHTFSLSSLGQLRYEKPYIKMNWVELNNNAGCVSLNFHGHNQLQNAKQ